MNFEKYQNKKPYPKLLKQAYPEPDRCDFESCTQWGVALDQWEEDTVVYKSKRKKLIEEYLKETNENIGQFFEDLIVDMGWDHYTKKQQDAISGYVWEKGHSHGFEECYNVALNLDDFVTNLLD